MQLDYDELATAYAANRTVHPQVLRRLVETGRIDAGSRVLEVGCGTGNYARALVSATGCRCWGVDPSAGMLAEARRGDPALALTRGTAERLDFESGCFDVVFSVDVIHHVKDRLRAYEEAARVVREGGRVCTVTDSEQIIRTRRPLAEFFPETIAVDLARYPPMSELRALMCKAELDEIGEEQAGFCRRTDDVEPYRARVFSSLRLISGPAFRRGLRRLEARAAEEGFEHDSRYVLLWGTRRTGNG
jgi:ubiquinone/menaquinone biosynthesis C-methylase UbiE